MVAPYAGAWIEIMKAENMEEKKKVAPYAGAWIEIFLSLHNIYIHSVAPYAGAWIEISKIMFVTLGIGGRSLRGSVD